MKLSTFQSNVSVLAFLLVSVESFAPNSVGGIRSTLPTTGAAPQRAFLPRPHFAASSNTIPPPNDEAERLRNMAAKLRSEAASLEAEQKAAISQVVEKVFQKFDVNKDGSISFQELKKGLEKLFKMDIPDKRVNQLITEFDANGDGALQLEEFAGVDAFRNRLDSLAREERSLARQQAKEEQSQADAAKELELKQAILNDNPPTTQDKLVSVLPYLFPLLDGLQFAGPLVQQHADNPVANAAVVAYTIYRSIPLGGFLSFFALSFLSGNPRLNKLVRFNMQQAIFLDVALFLPGLLATLVGLASQASGMSLPTGTGEIGADAVLAALVAVIGYSSVSSLLGAEPNQLPFISKAVEDRMLTLDQLDDEGRFLPPDQRNDENKN